MRKLILISVIAVLVVSGCSLKSANKTITLEEAKTKTVDFINNNLVQAGSEVTLKEATEEDGLYKIVINMTNGQEIISYITKDGKKFFPQVMDIAEIEAKAQERQDQQAGAQAQAAQDIPKTEKAKAELFVMAFCPYGTIAETAMLPVYELLKDKADIELHFIASIEGDDINQVKSLHGPIEGTEDARQVCVENNYGRDVLWAYLAEINEKCYPIYRNGEDAYEECWQSVAENAGASVAKLDSCVENEGPDLIRAEDTLSKSYGVTGSPTLIINGVKANVARTPEGYKTAICNGFENPPEECSATLSSEGGTASGGCN